MILFHAAWLAGLWLLAYDRPVEPVFLALFVVLQIARFWVLATLGRRWTIRVIVVPGERLVARGPYRFLRHPNYAVVTGEIAVVPLALGLPAYALVFSILNAGDAGYSHYRRECRASADRSDCTRDEGALRWRKCIPK